MLENIIGCDIINLVPQIKFAFANRLEEGRGMDTNHIQEVNIMSKATKRGRPKKAVKYTKTINVRLTQEQWVEVLNWAQKANLEPSVYIRKILLDFLGIKQIVV